MITLTPEDIKAIQEGITITGAKDYLMLRDFGAFAFGSLGVLLLLIIGLLKSMFRTHEQNIKTKMDENHKNVNDWMIKKDTQCENCHDGLVGNDDKLKIEVMTDVQKCEEVIIRGQDNLRDSLLLKFEEHVKWKIGLDKKLDRINSERLTIDSVKALILDAKDN